MVSIGDITSERGPHKPFCDQLEAQIDTITSLLTRSQSYINNQILIISDKCDELYASGIESTGIELAAINADIANAISVEMPDFSNVNDIIDVLNGCSIVQGNVLRNPDNVFLSVQKSISEAITSSIDAVNTGVDALLEFAVANLIYLFETWLDNVGIPAKLLAFDDILLCVDSICKRDITSKFDNLTSLLEGMGLTIDGELNRVEIYANASLSTTQILNIEALITELESGSTVANDIVTQAKGAITSALNTVKDSLSNLSSLSPF